MLEKHRNKVKALAIVVPLLGSLEGVRRVAYLDPVGIPTVCMGETLGVHLGQSYTKEQCDQMLAGRLDRTFVPGVEKCVTVDMGPEREAALISFAYNVGVGAFCKSGLVRRLNEGDPHACDELLKWTKARGITLPGLVRRREEERALCMKG